MPLIAFLLLTIGHFMSGYGILTLFGIRLSKPFTITLSLLLGMAVASFIPFLLQLFYIVLTGTSIFLSLAATALLLNIPTFLRIRREGFGPGAAGKAADMASGIAAVLASGRKTTSNAPFRSFRSFRMRPYEIPFLLIIGFMVFVSVWRCYYLPPTSRDALSGPEAIAEYAVREHTMINSFFSVDLWSTNNQFKSPYLISLQLIYKLAGFPFGQVWLSTIFVSFTIFLYHALRQRVHPVIAGFLLLLFTMVPEIYSYTFLILYDYSNMVFFFLSLYFLFDYFGNGPAAKEFATSFARPAKHLYFAGLLMGIATYIRSETLVLAVLFLPFLLRMQLREKYPVKKIVRAQFFFLLPSLVGYYLPSQLYIKYYLPVHYNVGGQVNHHLNDWQPLIQRYKDIITRLMTGEFSVQLWGYILYIFFFLFLAELIFLRRFSKEARDWLYAIVVVYLGLGLLGWILPLMNLLESTKRGLFKLIPLIIFYMAANGWLTRLSSRIYRWEMARAKVPAPASPPSQKKKGK
jgi:hypothetical protein